jgi:hypothetical protein
MHVSNETTCRGLVPELRFFFFVCLFVVVYMNAVVGFGSSFQVMAQESVMYDQNSFTSAKQLIDKMDASLGISTFLCFTLSFFLHLLTNFKKGGTNLKTPLEWIFRQRASFEYPRQVFVLTDGQLDDTSVVLEMVKRCSGINYSSFTLLFFYIAMFAYFR